MKTDIDKTYQYRIMDPTGNITALVETPAEISRQPFIAEQIMKKHPEVEQTGFVTFDLSGKEKTPVSLRMAGGEFCGNATLCAAALFAEHNPGICTPGKELLLTVSGAKEPVPVQVKKETEGVYKGVVRMPKAEEIRTVHLTHRGISGEATLVKMQGISHLILEEGSPFFLLKHHRLLAEAAARTWAKTLSQDGLGLMFLSGRKPHLSLSPLVCIPQSGTLFWEHSCGSGSVACSLYYARKEKKPVSLRFEEPGGTLHVEADGADGIRMTGIVKMCGAYIL